MKFTINIEATPDEAREFLGLPDVKQAQEKFMEQIEAKMQDTIQNLDAETFMKTWMPATIQSFGDMQKAFWGQMGINPENFSDSDTKENET